MHDYTGWIARSTAGHDKGSLLCVVGVDQGACRLLVADGKRRKTARPKQKKLGHLEMVCCGTCVPQPHRNSTDKMFRTERRDV